MKCSLVWQIPVRTVCVLSAQPGGVPPHQVRLYGLNFSSSTITVMFWRYERIDSGMLVSRGQLPKPVVPSRSTATVAA